MIDDYGKSGYNDWPDGVLDARNPWWRRVWLCCRYRRRWAETEFRYFTTLHRLSTAVFPAWGVAPATFGGKNVEPQTPEDQ